MSEKEGVIQILSNDEEQLLGCIDGEFALTINFDQATRIREKI